MKEEKKPIRKKGKSDVIDFEIGKKIRFRRMWLNMSQQEVADKIGVSIQQIQKYETGTNRVAVGRLQALSSALKTDIGYFFKNLSSNVVDNDNNDMVLAENTEPYIHDIGKLNPKEVTSCLKAFGDIDSPELRKKLVELMGVIKKSALNS